MESDEVIDLILDEVESKECSEAVATALVYIIRKEEEIERRLNFLIENLA